MLLAAQDSSRKTEPSKSASAPAKGKPSGGPKAPGKPASASKPSAAPKPLDVPKSYKDEVSKAPESTAQDFVARVQRLQRHYARLAQDVEKLAPSLGKVAENPIFKSNSNATPGYSTSKGPSSGW